MSQRSFRKVNENLGKEPGVAGFSPHQIIPWTVIAGVGYYVGQIFRFSWLWTVLIILWGIATWWVVTGSKPWRFLAKFVGTPYWVRGYGRYRRVLSHEQEVTSQRKSQ